VPRFKRLCLSLAGTASVALASLPLAIGPASATRVPEGSTSSIGVMEASSNASQFNLGSHRAQGLSTELVGQTQNLYLITQASRTSSISNVKKPPGTPDSKEGKPIGGNNGMERCPTGTVFATGNGGCGGGGIPAAKPRDSSRGLSIDPPYNCGDDPLCDGTPIKFGK